MKLLLAAALALFPALVLGSQPAAADLTADAAAEATAAPADPRVRGIFDTELPRTEWRRHLRLIFHPHFGDLARRDHLRVPLGLRYGLTEQWDATAEIEGHLSHGLGGVPFGRKIGLGGLRFSTKYHWREWLRPFVETATGITVAMPLGHPPPDVTDGLEHVTPFITFSRELESWPGMTMFLGLSYDSVKRTDIVGRRRRNFFKDDSWNVTPGFVWERGTLRYTCEFGLMSSEGVSSAPNTVVTVRPGASWQLPRKFTFGSETRWIMGLGVPLAFGPEGTDVSASVKFRGDFDFKRLLGRRR